MPSDGQYMQIFSLQDSILCYIDSFSLLVCQATVTQKVTIQASSLYTRKWYHLTLSVSQNGTSYLQLEDNTQIYAQSSSTSFNVQQKQIQGWNACFGSCLPDQQGFLGGIREFYLQLIPVLSQDATINKNKVIHFQPTIAAYYRMQGPNTFGQDQFSGKSFSFNVRKGRSRADLLKYDFVPNDICPEIFGSGYLPQFDQQHNLNVYQVKTQLLETHYDYTMILATFIKPGTCATNNFRQALNGCNLVNLGGVFMLYLQSSTQARIHFFASQSYYETQTSLFTLPLNQWVSIQLALSQYKGYKLVVLDQNENVLYQTVQSYDLRKMVPDQTLTLFQGLQGFVTNFLIFNKQLALPVQDEDVFQNIPLIRLDFTIGLSRLNQTKLQNLGSDSNAFTYKFVPNQVFVPYVWNEFRDLKHQKTEVSFDGITCNDGHRALFLESSLSFINFDTPSLKGDNQQNTIEFWFRLQDPSVYNSFRTLFVLKDALTNLTYWSVNIENPENSFLTVKPFPNSEQTISFKEFTLSNQDFFQWWHISCNSQFQVAVQCTLNNTVIEVSYGFDLDSNDTTSILPNNSLQATFGNKIDSLIEGVSQTFIKEFRFWSKAIPPEEVSTLRMNQVDPQVSNGLVKYLRFASDLSTLFGDLAPLNPKYKYTAVESGSMNQVAFISEYQITNVTANIGASVQIQQVQVYHTICPLNTYFMNGVCYNEPVNEMILAVVPSWNGTDLQWILTLQFSSLIKPTFLQELDPTWQTTDQYLSDYLKNQQKSYNITLDQNQLRQDTYYSIIGSLSNPGKTFTKTKQIVFVPNQCQWFEVDGYDSYSAKVFLNQGLNQSDISILLVLKTNPNLNCLAFDFFDEFDSISFQFSSFENSFNIQNQPQVQYQVITIDNGQPGSKANDMTADNLGIQITIPQQEQLKLPQQTQITLLMSLIWGSSKYGVDNTTVFQNVIYSFSFAPTNTELIVVLSSNSAMVTFGQTLILDASNSTLTNFNQDLIKQNLVFSWTCPQNLTQLCLGQKVSMLFIPWIALSNVPIEFGIEYQFTVNVNFVNTNGAILTGKQSINQVWYNTVVPQFNITQSPLKSTFSMTTATTFTLIPTNFKTDRLAEFTINWSITPPIMPSLEGGPTFVIPSGVWQQNTNYTVTVQLIYVNSPAVNNSRSVSFQMFGPPQNGTVTVTPMSGSVGDPFTVSLDGWVSQSELPISYLVFNTQDSQGLTRGILITKKQVPQNQTLTFIATNVNPIQVVVYDQSGENVANIILLEIQPSSIQSNQPSTSQNPANPFSSTQTATTQVSGTNGQQGNQVNLPNITQDPFQNITIATTSLTKIKAAQSNLTSIPNLNSSSTNKIANSIKNITSALKNKQRNLEDQSLSTLPLLIKNQISQGTLNSGDIQNFVSIIVKEVQKDQLTNSYFNDALNSFDYMISATHNEQTKIKLISLLETIFNESRNISNSQEQILKRLFEIDQKITYRGHQIQIQSLKLSQLEDFNSSSQTLKVFDVLYSLDQQPAIKNTLLSSIAYEDAYIQAIAMRNQQNQTEVMIRVVDQTPTWTEIGQINGQIVISYNVDVENFNSGQVQCQVLSADSKQWSNDLCLTEVQVEIELIQCTCNMIDQKMVRLNVYASKKLGSAITFPSQVIKQQVKQSQIQGFSYFLITLICFICIFGVIGSAFLCRKDQIEAVVSQEENQQQSHFLKEVHNLMNEQNLNATFILKKQLLKLYEQNESLIILVIQSLHPLLNPFTTVDAERSRLLRFVSYWFQVLIYTIGCLLYFGSNYRLNDHLRQQMFLDQIDLTQASIAVLVGGISLLPIVQDNLVHLLSNKVNLEQVIQQRTVIRTTFILSVLLLNLAVVAIAVDQCENSPASNQYLMAFSIFGGIFTATFVTTIFQISLVYLLHNCLPQWMNSRSRMIISVLNATNLIKMKQQQDVKQTPKTTTEMLETGKGQENTFEFDTSRQTTRALKQQNEELQQIQSELPPSGELLAQDTKSISFGAIQRGARTDSKNQRYSSLF